MKFKGTDNYVATTDLMLAVNAAITLKRPLLVKGEPGTGKTMLAEEVAGSLGMPLLQWHIKSTTKAQQGLYEYDAVSRLRDSQLGDERVKDIHNYIKFPDADTIKSIVGVHCPGLKKELLGAALRNFYDVRNLPGLKKKPSTSELLDWLKLLVAEDIPLDALQSKDEKVSVPPLV